VVALILSLLISLLGCGSDAAHDPNESETTRAIREKVRADMERERLERIGQRLASINEALASSPTAVGMGASRPGAEEPGSADGDETGGVDLAQGESIYTRNCGSCHGPRGDGDGPLGAALVPQPAKHSDGSYMNALSNDHLFKVIEQGGGAVGKSPMMAPWGMTLSDNQIHSVVAFIRTLADPPYAGTSPDDV